MSSKQRYDIAPYADIEIPNYRETVQTDVIHDTSAWSLVVISANTLLAIVLIVGMVQDGKSVTLSIVSGASYYAFTTIAVIAISSGQAGILWRTWQSERTERYRIDAYEYLAERKLELETPRMIAADPVQTLATLQTEGSYVTPYAPGAIDEARRWLLGLYRRDGHLDPARVRSGYVQGSVIGSKRSGGSAESLELLKAHRVIRLREGGYEFNAKRYPTTAHVERLFNALQGRGVGVSG